MQFAENLTNRQAAGAVLPPTDLPRETLKEAVSEIVDYAELCVSVAGRLSNLAPIPLKTIELLEYGL